MDPRLTRIHRLGNRTFQAASLALGSLGVDGPTFAVGYKSRRPRLTPNSPSQKTMSSVAVITISYPRFLPPTLAGHVPQRRTGFGLTLALSVLLFSICFAGITAVSASAAPRVVSLQSLYQASAAFGRPVVDVEVAHSKPIPVVLDTGSVGLLVAKSALLGGKDSGLHFTDKVLKEHFGLLPVWWTSRIAKATVSVGGVDTASPIPLGIVSTILCRGHDCADEVLDRSQTLGIGHVEGILGIGLYGSTLGTPLVNPLLFLPAPYRSGWTLSLGDNGDPGTGDLILGQSSVAHPVATLHLTALGGHPPSWVDQPYLCWSIPADGDCVPTLLDSGSDGDVLVPAGRRSPIQNPPAQYSPLNQSVSMSTSADPGGTFYSFDTSDPWHHLSVDPRGGSYSGYSILGVGIFFALDVAYNPIKGEITLGH
jgi:hypothetical protein